MEGNESPRLVKILIRLARNWAICKNRYDRAMKRLRTAERAVGEGDGSRLDRLDEEAVALDATYHDHPFLGLVRLVSHETGFEQAALRDAALKEFDGQRDLVTELNSLDEKGTTVTLFEKLRSEYPDVARNLFGAERDGTSTEVCGQSPLADLLDRAGKVFGTANKLGSELQEEMLGRAVILAGEESPRDRHRPLIKEFTTAVLDLRDVIQNPPDGFAAVAEQLREAGKTARRIQKVDGGRILELVPELNTVARDGSNAVQEARDAKRLDDPFAFLDDAPTSAASHPLEPVGGHIAIDGAAPFRSELQQLGQRIDGALREYVDRAADAVPDQFFVRPQSLEDWERLARIVGVSPNNETFDSIAGWAGAWVDRETIKARLLADVKAKPNDENSQPVNEAVEAQFVKAQRQPPPTRTKPKRSTERGEGRTKLIAALTKHHQYADGGCLNLEPIGNNELARLADVSESTASTFFNKEFDGHTKYRAACGDATRFVAALKLLNQEFSPYHLFGGKPVDEGEREDKE